MDLKAGAVLKMVYVSSELPFSFPLPFELELTFLLLF